LRTSDTTNALKVQMVGAWGNVLHLSVSAMRVRRADESAPMIIAVIEDATPREAGQDARAERHRMQRDALIREVHHRIKNHLQGVAGLLRQHLAGKPLLQPLLEAATAQVLTIAAVHGLQGEMQGGVIDLRGFVARIAASISGIMHVPIVLGERCALLEGLCVAEEEAVPVAMVLNELLMNAVKHRLRTDADAMVRIDVLRDGDDVRIMVRNAGFLPPRFDFQLGAQVGNGLGLVRSLLPQHGAALSIVEDGEDVIATLSLTSPAMLVPITARLRAYAEHAA
jgi:two-component sensor histidine kinase